MSKFAPSKIFQGLFKSDLHLVIAFIAFFITAFIFSLLINGLFLRFSKTLGIRNHTENLIRWNSTSKPAFGGISFYIIFLISIAALSFIFRQNYSFYNISFLGFIAAATLGFLMGLFDDAYNTKVWLKLFTQISCGIILIITGTYIHLFENAWMNYLLTLIWVVGIMNSINMLDNMDSITTIVSLFVFITCLIALLVQQNLFSPFIIVLIGLIASLLGFLFYNRHPSKMYMGDTGSQFLGIVLAIFGILFFWNQDLIATSSLPWKRIMLVAVMFILPLTDTTTVVIKRISKGKSPFIGGKDHTTHHLSYMGLSDRQVALVFLGISMISSALVAIAVITPTWGWLFSIILCIHVIAVFTFLFIIGNKNAPK